MSKMGKMKNKLFAMILTAMVALSMTVPVFVEAVYAAEGQGVNENAQEINDVNTNEEDLEQETNEAVAPETNESENLENVPAQEENEEEIPSAKLGIMKAAEDSIKVKASGDEGRITVVWSKVEDADYYMLYLDENETGVKLDAKKDGKDAERRYVFNNAATNTVHIVRVEAYKLADEDDDVILATGSALDIKAILRSKLKGSPSVPATYTGLNMRSASGQKHNGCAVAQGSVAVPEKNAAYHLMVCSVSSSSNYNKGIIVKTSIDGKKYLGCSGVLDVAHGNGMTYDSKRGKLVTVGYGKRRQQLCFIDPDNFSLSKSNVTYQNKIKIESGGKDIWNEAKENGLAAISYIPEHNVYLARSRGRVNNYESITTTKTRENIWVINADTLEAIGHIYTKIVSDYPGTYQAMDADSKYVYYLISPSGSQTKNRIICLDWNSEKLLPVLNGDETYIKDMWKCGNGENGLPDAVISIPISHESEGLYHTTDENGNSHFYVTEYYGRYKYKTVTKKKAYKVKWKKVKKKVKWKKVRKNGKWKWKYKKKKVWKYKKKYKTVKVKVKDYYMRDDYVYDLGII